MEKITKNNKTYEIVQQLRSYSLEYSGVIDRKQMRELWRWTERNVANLNPQGNWRPAKRRT